MYRYLPWLFVFVTGEVLSAVPTVTGSNATEPLSTANLTQWTIGLIVVLMMIFAVAWAAKRFSTVGTSRAGGLKVLSGVSLGHREKAVLVKAGSRHLLLGVAPGRVVNLHTFESGEIPEEVTNPQEGFKESLQKIMKKQPAE
jgi:flagellar protein FliO/FliZ